MLDLSPLGTWAFLIFALGAIAFFILRITPEDD